MLYKITNIEEDDFIALILKELEVELKEADRENIYLQKIIKDSDDDSKGVDILTLILSVKQEIDTFAPELIDMISNGMGTITLGVISATVYDYLKSVINKHKKLKEYSSKKKIKIEVIDNQENKVKVIITLEEILKK